MIKGSSRVDRDSHHHREERRFASVFLAGRHLGGWAWFRIRPTRWRRRHRGTPSPRAGIRKRGKYWQPSALPAIRPREWGAMVNGRRKRISKPCFFKAQTFRSKSRTMQRSRVDRPQPYRVAGIRDQSDPPRSPAPSARLAAAPQTYFAALPRVPNTISFESGRAQKPLAGFA